MTAEAIANVVADLEAGRRFPIMHPGEFVDPADREWADEGRRLQAVADSVAQYPGPTVDATAIYRSLVDRDEPVDLYGDHPNIAPPWPAAKFCYVNEHGNVIVMSASAADLTEGHDADVATDLDGARARGSQPALWEPAEPVDWDEVRWVIDTFLWIGGRGGSGPLRTAGPLHMWRFAVYADGTPADLHWLRIYPDYPMERWDMAHLVLLGSLNFLGCRNVDIVEPARPRAEARRVARTGVRVHTLNVFPAGKATRTASGDRTGGVPLTSVRGHFAHYGPDYGKGLLFGKHAGRFWVPQFARGAAEHGESEHDYVLRSEAS